MLGEISITSDTQMTIFTAESGKEMKLKEEIEKFGLKLNIKKLRSWHPVSSLHGK